MPRLLLVDNCPLQRLLGMAFLARWLITPMLACDGKDAILLAGEEEFDLILMDLDMPGIDGFAATKSIRRQERLVGRHERVPVIAYTANPSVLPEGCWSRSGLDAVLAKPSEVAEMGACLRRWCPDRVVVDSLTASARR